MGKVDAMFLKPDEALVIAVGLAGFKDGERVIRLFSTGAGTYSLEFLEVRPGTSPGERWSVADVMSPAGRAKWREAVPRRDLPRAVSRLMGEYGMHPVVPSIFLHEPDGLQGEKCSWVDLSLVQKVRGWRLVEVRYCPLGG